MKQNQTDGFHLEIDNIWVFLLSVDKAWLKIIDVSDVKLKSWNSKQLKQRDDN